MSLLTLLFSTHPFTGPSAFIRYRLNTNNTNKLLYIIIMIILQTTRVPVFIIVHIRTRCVIFEYVMLDHVCKRVESRLKRRFDAKTAGTARTAPPASCVQAS